MRSLRLAASSVLFRAINNGPGAPPILTIRRRLPPRLRQRDQRAQEPRTGTVIQSSVRKAKGPVDRPARRHRRPPRRAAGRRDALPQLFRQREGPFDEMPQGPDRAVPAAPQIEQLARTEVDEGPRGLSRPSRLPSPRTAEPLPRPPASGDAAAPSPSRRASFARCSASWRPRDLVQWFLPDPACRGRLRSSSLTPRAKAPSGLASAPPIARRPAYAVRLMARLVQAASRYGRSNGNTSKRPKAKKVRAQFLGACEGPGGLWRSSRPAVFNADQITLTTVGGHTERPTEGSSRRHLGRGHGRRTGGRGRANPLGGGCLNAGPA